MTEPDLEVEDLEVQYGPVPAVRALSLRLQAGSVVALVGSNGAGKSTTLRAISGLTKPKAGRIRLGGDDMTSWSAYKRARRGLAHVPEGRRLFGRLTVEENLKVADRSASKRNDQTSAITTVVELFPELAERLAQPAGSLSGGEQQMVAIGRALMASPQVVMLDEPALGLAPVVVKRVAAAIRALAAEGRSILLAEQHIDLALRCADELHVLILGTVRESLLVPADDDERDTVKNEVLEMLIGGREALPSGRTTRPPPSRN